MMVTVTNVTRPVRPAHRAETTLPQRPERGSARRRTTHALVVDQIRDMILAGELKPGDRLRVDELASALGVSPMPVREALHQLAGEGTVTLDPFRGFSIAELSAKEAVDLYSTRAALETLAARIAVPRLDEATLTKLREILDRQARACRRGDATEFIHWDLTFHRELYAASDRPLLTRQVLGLINSSVRYSRANLPLPGAMEAALAAHRTIFEACERRDAALAAKVTCQHTEQAAQRVLRLLESRRAAEEPPAARSRRKVRRA
jgi:DNA-binding GntR family transcriptional regulator